ncbi:protein containing cyclic nucleotide-binding domain [Anaerolinea thermolimosa]|nr:protein containing cyclic nucleotide-binding domain [Anaerolinea thermolimosa]
MESQAPVINTLQRIPWFNELSRAALEKLAIIAKLRELADGEVLFREGDAENCLYILLEGEILLETHVPGYGTVSIFRAEPLDVIGWSVLTPVVRQRTDTARALTACRLLCFDSDMLRQYCDDDQVAGYIIMRRIANVAASRLLTTRLHLFEVIRELTGDLAVKPETKMDK